MTVTSPALPLDASLRCVRSDSLPLRRRYALSLRCVRFDSLSFGKTVRIMHGAAVVGAAAALWQKAAKNGLLINVFRD